MQLTSILCSAILATTFCADPAERPKPKITISKETTYITEPVREDGYVDYQAALNARLGKGVTPENNAAVLLLKAFGTKVIDEPIRKKTLELMGAKDLTEEGDGFVTLEDFMNKNHPGEDLRGQKVEDSSGEIVGGQEEQATKLPWSKNEYPRLAECLAVNETALKTITEASKRPCNYFPVAMPEDEDFSRVNSIPDLSSIRAAIRLLRQRAMNYVSQDKFTEAQQDIAICYRLAAQQKHRPFLLAWLLQSAYSSMTDEAVANIALTEKLDVNEAKKLLVEIDRYYDDGPSDNAINFGERLYCISGICDFAAKGFNPPHYPDNDLTEKLFGAKAPYNIATKKLLTIAQIDWNAALRIANRHFDLLNELLHQKDAQSSEATLKRLDATIPLSQKKAIEEIEAKDFSSHTFTAKESALRLIALQLEGSGIITLRGIQKGRLGRLSSRQCTRFSLALAGYRAEHGAYPKELGALAPEYFSELPKDPFSGGEFIYRAEGTGYVLYSVGPNGKDDGGRNFSDTTSENPIPEDADDIAIRKR